VLRLTLRSAATLLLSALAGSLVVFGLLRLLGGDVALVILGPDSLPEARAALAAQFGLDRPWYVQYFDWIRGLAVGDLGTSYAARFDIAEQIWRRLGVTSLLAFSTLIISAFIALVLGTYSAIHVRDKRGTLVDLGAQVGMAVPNFWAGLILVTIFAIGLGWLPAGGYEPFSESPLVATRFLLLPVAALGLSVTANLTRFVRSGMIDVLNDSYINTAMAKGRTLGSAVIFHGVRNAAIPLVTVATISLGNLIAGAVVIENVFVLPGLGRLLLVSVQGREAIVVQSTVFVILLIILVMNFLMDIAYGLLDPRIRDKQGGPRHG
jgi:peptide/nickel transport system permease protein